MDKVDFSILCKAFYGGRGREKTVAGLNSITSKSDIARFFIDVLLDRDFNATTIENDPRTYSNYFNSDTNIPNEYWVKGYENFKKKENFIEKVASNIRVRLSKSDALYNKLVKYFGINLKGRSFNDILFCRAIAVQMRELCNNGGISTNVVALEYEKSDAPVEMRNFVIKVREDFECIRTDFYVKEKKAFKDFFVCNNISKTMRLHPFKQLNASKDILSDATIYDLTGGNAHALIGMEGIGKTMMLHHFFLADLEAYEDKGIIPVYIELRNYRSNEGLMALITRFINKYDDTFALAETKKMLIAGKCHIYMDGLDEVYDEDRKQLIIDMDELMSKYAYNRFVISTRDMRLLSNSKFIFFWILPFNYSQSVRLIQNLKSDSDEGTEIIGKKVFVRNLKKYYEQGLEYLVSVPLILITWYALFCDLCEEAKNKGQLPTMDCTSDDYAYDLYNKIYDTMLIDHDELKPQYHKVYYSVDTPDELTNIFSELGGRSCRHGIRSFSEREFDRAFRELHSTKNRTGKLTLRGFEKDLVNKACLMIHDGRSFSFLHRSIQDYLFAEYYSNVSETDFSKLGKYLANEKGDKPDDVAFMLLYKAVPEKVEKFIFLPLLNTIFGVGDDLGSFYTFLKKCYGKIMVTIYDPDRIKNFVYNEKPKEQKIGGGCKNSLNSPGNYVMLMLMKIRKIKPDFWLELTDPVPHKDITGSVICINTGNRLEFRTCDNDKIVHYLGSCVMGKTGRPLIFGHEYTFDPFQVFHEPERYSEVNDNLRDSGAWKNWQKLKGYYDDLHLREDEIDQELDDDF